MVLEVWSCSLAICYVRDWPLESAQKIFTKVLYPLSLDSWVCLQGMASCCGVRLKQSNLDGLCVEKRLVDYFLLVCDPYCSKFVKLVGDWKLLLTGSFKDLSGDEIHKYSNLVHHLFLIFYILTSTEINYKIQFLSI